MLYYNIMSDKIFVRTHVYDSSTCRYCGGMFEPNDLIDFIYDGDPAHQNCMLEREENEIRDGKAKRCSVCNDLIVNPKNGTFDSHLYDGKYIHPLCKD